MSVLDHVARALALLRETAAAPYLVGVSGGRDSVALLHALVECGAEALIVCHLDHGLRPESGADAQFVAALAERLGCRCTVGRATVALDASSGQQSLETAARDARYRFFAETARATGASVLFLGHHADDQVETLLFRLFRGTGVAGLAAMSEESHREIGGRELRIVRPLLSIWRTEIDAYIAARGLEFREDHSNADPRHTRNRLRHELLPAIERAYGREVRETLWRAAEIARADNEYIRQHPLLNAPLEQECPVKLLRAAPVAIQRRYLQHWLRARGVRDVGFAEVERVRGLLHEERPAKVNLPGNCHARRRAGRLFIEKPQ